MSANTMNLPPLDIRPERPADPRIKPTFIDVYFRDPADAAHFMEHRSFPVGHGEQLTIQQGTPVILLFDKKTVRVCSTKDLVFVRGL